LDRKILTYARQACKPCKKYLISTDIPLEEGSTGEEETLRPQVRERSGSKIMSFKKRHILVSEDNINAFENQLYALSPLAISYC